jgi:sec-independent protein translocase protein TatB
MMPQIGFSEMLLIGILALVVLGPKDLPLMMRKFGKFTGKLRAMAWEFQRSFDELGRQAELDELRKEVEDLKRSSGVDEINRDLNESQADFEAEVERRNSKFMKPDSKTDAAE